MPQAGLGSGAHPVEPAPLSLTLLLHCQMDSSGVSRAIECDDHEALLVGAWVRTGCWLQPHLLRRFELTMLNDIEVRHIGGML